MKYQVGRPIKLQYFGLLREQRGLGVESIETNAGTARDLYVELAALHGFMPKVEQVWVAINNAFVAWDQPLASDDTISFIPPAATVEEGDRRRNRTPDPNHFPIARRFEAGSADQGVGMAQPDGDAKIAARRRMTIG